MGPTGCPADSTDPFGDPVNHSGTLRAGNYSFSALAEQENLATRSGFFPDNDAAADYSFLFQLTPVSTPEPSAVFLVALGAVVSLRRSRATRVGK